MSDLIAHFECTACGHQARLPVEALGVRRGPALWRLLRCSRCGALGKAEVRILWPGSAADPLAAGHRGREVS